MLLNWIWFNNDVHCAMCMGQDAAYLWQTPLPLMLENSQFIVFFTRHVKRQRQEKNMHHEAWSMNRGCATVYCSCCLACTKWLKFPSWKLLSNIVRWAVPIRQCQAILVVCLLWHLHTRSCMFEVRSIVRCLAPLSCSQLMLRLWKLPRRMTGGKFCVSGMCQYRCSMTEQISTF